MGSSRSATSRSESAAARRAAALAERVRRELVDSRVAAGHWEGHLSSSALATATAVVALWAAGDRDGAGGADRTLIERGVAWLAAHQNGDGGWGDTPDSLSNVSTTALAHAALGCGSGAVTASAAARAAGWLEQAGGGGAESLAAALGERYGQDRTFSVPILTMCAIAGGLGPDEAAWRLVPQLPFELAVLPRRFFGALRLPVVSYALPALISMGLARHVRGPRSGLAGAVRDRLKGPALERLLGLQPDGGGFLEAIPLTSFVAMSLAAAGERDHPVVARGLAFLRRSVRDDGSWAIDSNLATWVTTLSVNALAATGGLLGLDVSARSRIRDWLLDQQWLVEHPYTGAAPGGWAWTDLPGGVPDADDTAGALIALAHLDPVSDRVRYRAALGVRWLLDLQNRDGGIPTFCRGWGALPFDRSATDLTAHALRAWTTWLDRLERPLRARAERACHRALAFLERHQRADGAFVPLWFGNQRDPHEENAVLGTARVLRGITALERMPDRTRVLITHAARWLLGVQHADGGWGSAAGVPPSIEETAVAITGLARARSMLPDADTGAAIWRAFAWLERAFAQEIDVAPAPIGLYFARLWYGERLYPLIFATEALGCVRAMSHDGGALPADDRVSLNSFVDAGVRSRI